MAALPNRQQQQKCSFALFLLLAVFSVALLRGAEARRLTGGGRAMALQAGGRHPRERFPSAYLAAQPRYGPSPYAARSAAAEADVLPPAVYWAADPPSEQFVNLKRGSLLARLANQSARGFGKK